MFTWACHWSLLLSQMYRSLYTSSLFMIHFNPILLSMIMSCKWSLLLMFVDQNFILISHRSCMCYLFHPTLFTDNTSIIFFNSESTDYATEFLVIFVKINLTICNPLLNLNKTNYVHFTAKSNTKIYRNIHFEDVQINNVYKKNSWINHR
jgi:hypothetical protein